MRLGVIGAICAAVAALPAVADPSNTTQAQPARSATALGQRHRPAVVEHHVDINSASREELMTLPGIGAADADRIVANRPYLTKTELVTKKVLPVGPFVSVKNRVVAMPSAAPKAGQ